ncbi:MHS family proline/betaine transporter-like MFS transporter [Halopolyspora algeriensis]|uniref:Putative proline/betaine transporter n=1 Tax=Halopolyspora algeriensis TaxID=1500506 RepID=A0A368VAI7_9ACTN|nr:MFS transporter [Halopolyspora algeriensis]RCW38237.1 MHS family proline/betaine transporter-like MFS transporter [Halopolyspora algeriensis]TQM56534.1 MHS family proline/betaine transporter-like MFS transporter [Halopolyspora algeriensis]
MTASDTAEDTPEKQSLLRRAVAAAAIGNCTEWYDFGVYAYVATYVGAAFFPGNDPTLEALSAFGVFALSFLLRPLGSLFFGPLGDRIGRQRVLAVTILLMSGSTFAIGLLPGFSEIGYAAPALLLLCRMLQGFSTGGEYGGAATYIAEYAPNKRRGFYGSWLEFGTLVGFGLGALVPTALILSLSDPAMHSWGWRVPFLIAGPLGGVGLYLRKKLEDTPAFKHLEQSHNIAKSPLKAMLVGHWRTLLILMGIVVIINVGNYTLLTFMPTYLKQTLGITDAGALIPLIAVIIMMLALITFVGRLSDRVGRKPVFLSACICFIVLPIPAFMLIAQANWATTLLGLMLLGLCHVQLIGPLAATLPAMFPTVVRYAAFSIGYNIATSAIGGTTPLINEAMIEVTGNDFFPAYYLMAAAALGIIPVLLMKETAGKPLDEGYAAPGTTATSATS